MEEKERLREEGEKERVKERGERRQGGKGRRCFAPLPPPPPTPTPTRHLDALARARECEALDHEDEEQDERPARREPHNLARHSVGWEGGT